MYEKKLWTWFRIISVPLKLQIKKKKKKSENTPPTPPNDAGSTVA